MYSSDITMAVAAERRRELLRDAENWRRSERTRQRQRAETQLAGRVRAGSSRAVKTAQETG
jgi:hypothetical protein